MNNKHFKRIIFTQNQIEKKCSELSSWVNKTYKNSNDLIIVGLLKGSIPFMCQLIKKIDIIHKLDFMTISSYYGGSEPQGTPKIIMDLATNINGKDVLIVEDVIDTGKTLKTVKLLLKSRKPNSIKILALIDKKEGRKVKFKVDNYGFRIGNVFIVGFGLDVNDKLRNLPYIAEFDTKYLKKY